MHLVRELEKDLKVANVICMVSPYRMCDMECGESEFSIVIIQYNSFYMFDLDFYLQFS